MGLNEPYSVGRSYALAVLNSWLECLEISHEFRERLLAGASDDIETKKITRVYVARLTRLWVELLPKVEGNSEFNRDIAEEFIRMREYYFNPSKLLSQENAEDIFKLEAVIREVLEQMKITVFEE